MTNADVQGRLRDFLASARRWWRVRVLLRGAVAGVTLAALAVLVLAGATALGLLPPHVVRVVRWIPLLLLLPPLAASLLWALRHAPDDPSLALRLEELEPGAGHLPSILLELRSDHPFAPEILEAAAVPPHPPASTLAGRWIRGWEGAAAGAALGAVSILAASAGGPGSLWSSWGAGSSAAATPAEATAPEPAYQGKPDPFSRLRVRVSPPAYTDVDVFEASLSEPVRALAGSRVELRGPSRGAGAEPALLVQVVRADADPRLLSPEAPAAEDEGERSGEGEWSAGWTLDARDRGIVVTADRTAGGGRVHERVVPLEPVPDTPPEVELLEPTSDMVLATGSGEVTFQARARDPFGVGSFELSWVHTRGGGESFDFREGAREWSELRETDDGLEGTLTLRLDDLELGPGQVLHLRAVATDRNTVTGPGRGVSETRQIRVIREGEEMEVDALVGLPLEIEREPVLSQRMILLMTEDLLARRHELEPDAFAGEAYRIAGEQARLRAEVAEQVFSRATGAMEPLNRHLGEEAHDHGEHPEHEPPAGRGDREPARGSRYGVAAIFDPSVPDEPEPEAPHEAGPLPFPTGAGTDVGSFIVGGPGEMPTGFGVLEELGHDHDGDPILSVNRPLLEIHDAMWASERMLRQVAPDSSLPHQHEALDGLQALRENQRVFPRGQVNVPPVDVTGARGTGEIDDAAPLARSRGRATAGNRGWIGELERALAHDAAEEGRELTRIAARLLGDASAPPRAGALVAEAANREEEGDEEESERLVRRAIELLDPAPARSAEPAWVHAPSSPLAASLASPGGSAPSDGGAAGEDAVPDEVAVPDGASAPDETTAPFVFATLRYESGNWDSAPLVPQNLIHALAQYTDLPVEPEGVVVDLGSPEIFRYPVLYLTGHLPVRFSEAEASNLEAYVERGGFVFMDDHNHDVDGAFHRSATAELARIFGEDALEPLPNDHELYGAFFHFPDGPPTTSHELSGWGDGLIHPELHAVLVDGRIGVLYSNKDYSSEWSYHAVNKRFLAEDNTRFGVNILVYALTR